VTRVRPCDSGASAAPNAPYRGTAWGAQVRALLARAARDQPTRPALVDALGPVTVQRLYADVMRAARSLSPRGSVAPGGYRIISGPSDRRFITQMLATLVSGRTPVLAAPHAAAQAPALLAQAGAGCRAWKVTLDALGATLAAISTCAGPVLGDAELLAGLGMRCGDRALIAQPLFAPLAVEAALRQVLAGGTAVLAGPFEPERWLRLCATLSPDWALCTSTQLGRLLAQPGPGLTAAVAGVRTLMIDGQCPAPLRAAALRALPADRLTQYYATPLYHGASSTGAALAAAEPEHTVLPGAALHVVGDHADAPGGHGLIKGRAHSHPVGTPCPRPGAFAGWGERGAMTDAGRLIVTDTRVPGRAVIDGVGVALGRVHATLARHPSLTGVEVTASDDGFGAERLGARVQTANPALDEAALRTWCAAHLDAAERPGDLTLALTNGADP
jgi:hypothetical protein